MKYNIKASGWSEGQMCVDVAVCIENSSFDELFQKLGMPIFLSVRQF